MRVLQGLIAGIAASSCATTIACGVWSPKHGGTMSDPGETSFELVQKGKTTMVCIEDHGEAQSTVGARGTLTLKRGTREWTADMQPKGGNCLESAFGRKAVAGDVLSVRVHMGNASIVAGKFSITGAPAMSLGPGNAPPFQAIPAASLRRFN